jgi:hypothetical protein
MNAASTDQPDVESGVFDDLHRSHDRVVDPQVGVPEDPAAYPRQRDDIRQWLTAGSSVASYAASSTTRANASHASRRPLP